MDKYFFGQVFDLEKGQGHGYVMWKISEHDIVCEYQLNRLW